MDVININTEVVQPLTHYQKYKTIINASVKKYYEKVKNTDEYKKKNSTKIKAYYDTHPEYKEAQKQRALERYNKLKNDPEYKKQHNERVKASQLKKKLEAQAAL